MKPGLLKVTNNPDRWIIDLLDTIDRVSARIGVDYFVVGAMSRDIIFEYVNDIAAPRRTGDLDLGLRVASWPHFQKIKRALLDTGRFTEGRPLQRLLFDKQIPVDVVPFGDIAKQDQITWPPDFAIEMDVAGFEDAHQTAINVRLRDTPALDIKIASPAGLAAMKIIAWADRGPAVRSKDAEDLSFLINHYLDVQGIERITNEYPEWLNEDFDYTFASAQLLGADIYSLTQPIVRKKINGILRDEIDKGVSSELVLAMTKYSNMQNEEHVLYMLRRVYNFIAAQ